MTGRQITLAESACSLAHEARELRAEVDRLIVAPLSTYWQATDEHQLYAADEDEWGVAQ